MDVTIRKEKYLIDNETGLIFTSIESHCFNPHSHDFYELFLLVSGEMVHQLNDKDQHLSKGHMLLIAPGDFHCIKKYKNSSFHMLNFFISKKTFNSLMEFLSLHSSTFNRSIIGKITDMNKLSNYFSDFNKISKLPKYKKHEINLLSKQLLSNLLISLSLNHTVLSTDSAPLWFDHLLIEMNKKENYTYGVQRMYSISKKSPEYISRLFKKHLNMTPTEYINDVKLNHARVLLTITDMTILDICYDSGFNSLSNFYKAFEQLFGLSPGCFRKDISIHEKF